MNQTISCLTISAIALFSSAACLLGQSANDAAGSGQVIAEIGGQKLTVDELQQAEREKLFQAQQQLYQAERAALEQWIDDQVLQAEAKRQHMTVDELLEKTIHVADPTDDQMRVYYEGLNIEQPYDAVRDKILEHIRELRKARIRAAYVTSLRKKAGVLITFAPPSADVNTEEPIFGSSNAKIRLVEFADYQCPYCQADYSVVKKVLEHYGSDISFTFRDYPLPMHPLAPKAAEAARCAGVQGKRWEFYNALFTDKKLAVSDLKDEARKLSLDTTSFDKCLDSGAQKTAVDRDADDARRLQLTGTPTLFINGHIFNGAITFDELRSTIDKDLGPVASTVASKTASANHPLN